MGTISPSRRDVVAGTAGAAIAPAAASSARTGELQPLTSRSGVFTPARGDAVNQFSFDFPEPSVQIGPWLVSFRVQTFENVLAIDASRTRILRDGSRTRLICEGLLGRGGQAAAAGRLEADFDLDASGLLQWRARAVAPTPVKSITSVVRGLPRGELSVSCNAFTDHKDDEKVFEYPQLFGGMSTPLVVLKAADGRLFEIAARQAAVLPARFFFQPGPDGYRVELIHEAAGWSRNTHVETCRWRVGPAGGYGAAADGHFAHVQRTYGLPAWADRADAPPWMRQLQLVVALHGAHWTGYVFNTYARMAEILRWTASQIDARRVLVFLPAWDGRYYWNYPNYRADDSLGGPEGFAALVAEAQRLGFRVAPMFGANSANRRWPEFRAIADAATRHIDGDAFDLNWVDWDNDRRNEGWMPFMNLGVDSWRRWLGERIADVIARYHVDAWFLDIAGAWENNPAADMHEGTRRLVADLAARHPGVPPIGEMLYDAQMAYVPMSQVVRYAMHPSGQDAHIRSFEHLSRPAPGRGSTGVHEAGFSHFSPELKPGQRAIPTLTVVDDTFDAHRAEMAQVIAAAKSWKAPR